MHELQSSIKELEQIEPKSGHEHIEKRKLLEAYGKEITRLNKTMESIKETSISHEEMIQAVAFEDEGLMEKAKELKAIQGHIIEINHMLKDCSETILEQGKDLDTVENFVEISALESKGAADELEKANGYQKSGNKCYVCVLMMAFAVILIVVVIYLLSDY
jgi:predicted  nucleic acid-binding Zn-ribbon protein